MTATHWAATKYQKLLEYGEMVTLSPEQLLEIGLRELGRKQEVFAETARQIDPTRKPIEVFQAIQKDHPTEQSLIPDTAKNLDMIRQFVIDRQIVTLPSQGAGAGGGDPAVHARDQLRFDGHARPV